MRKQIQIILFNATTNLLCNLSSRLFWYIINPLFKQKSLHDSNRLAIFSKHSSSFDKDLLHDIKSQQILEQKLNSKHSARLSASAFRININHCSRKCDAYLIRAHWYTVSEHPLPRVLSQLSLGRSNFEGSNIRFPARFPTATEATHCQLLPHWYTLYTMNLIAIYLLWLHEWQLSRTPTCHLLLLYYLSEHRPTVDSPSHLILAIHWCLATSGLPLTNWLPSQG